MDEINGIIAEQGFISHLLEAIERILKNCFNRMSYNLIKKININLLI
jgi:hypothetical protein